VRVAGWRQVRGSPKVFFLFHEMRINKAQRSALLGRLFSVFTFWRGIFENLQKYFFFKKL
jgi:hypothetical protein